jgi:hypothetical protein
LCVIENFMLSLSSCKSILGVTFRAALTIRLQTRVGYALFFGYKDTALSIP